MPELEPFTTALHLMVIELNKGRDVLAAAGIGLGMSFVVMITSLEQAPRPTPFHPQTL